MSILHNLQILKDRRRELRLRSTKSEKILWEELRNNKLGVKFKRQHSVGGYILDFYCAAHKFVIELDGTSHDGPDQKEYDLIRDNFFKDLDYNVLRFNNKEVENNVMEVINKIKEFLN